MPREFTPKEAKELIAQYKKQRDRVAYIAMTPNKYINEIREDAANLINSHSLEEIIREEVINGSPVEPKRTDFLALITSIYKYLRLSPRIKTCQEDFEAIESFGRDAVKNLSHGTKNNLQ